MLLFIQRMLKTKPVSLLLQTYFGYFEFHFVELRVGLTVLNWQDEEPNPSAPLLDNRLTNVQFKHILIKKQLIHTAFYRTWTCFESFARHSPLTFFFLEWPASSSCFSVSSVPVLNDKQNVCYGHYKDHGSQKNSYSFNYHDSARNTLKDVYTVVNWVLLTFLPISFTAKVHPDSSGHRTCYVLLYKDDTNFRETKAFFPMNSMHLSVSLETAGFTRQI